MYAVRELSWPSKVGYEEDYPGAYVAASLRSLVRERLEKLELPFNEFGIDPYGISKRHLARSFAALGYFYKNYFSVAVHGAENVPARGRAMLIGNHSGGVAVDAAMVIASCFFEVNPPRLAQGMAEKFINRIPIASLWASRTGQFTGLPEHAERLLLDERLLMVFPEGARGTAKLYWERNSLVEFGTGFMRLALKTKTPIVPFGFLGGGEAVPTVVNSYVLGKLLGAPYIPFTPYGPPIPMPVRLQIRYGKPILIQGTGTEDDEVIFGHVARVKSSVARLMEEGLGDETTGSRGGL